MKRFHWSHLAPLVLALTLLSSLFFNTQPTSALGTGAPGPGGATASKAAPAQPANPQVNTVTTTNSVNTFSTIQAAIDAANPGDTVNVPAGTYVEQLDIGKAITLHGAGQGSTIIQSPPSLVTKFSTKKPIVYVHDTNAVVQNLTIDGLGLGNANISMVGAAFYNAGGTLDHTTIVHVRNTPLDGVQAGVGVYALVDNATPRTLTIDRNTVSDYQKNGMALKGVGLTVNVTNNTVTGAGVNPAIAQNGIQIGFTGGTGSITGNVVSGNFCTVPVCIGDPATSSADGAAGILLVDTSGPSITVANNLLTDNQYGVWSVGVAAVNIHDNTMLGAGGVGVSIWNGDGGETPQGTTGAIDHNTFNGLLYGLILRDYVASPTLAMTGHRNNFIGNTSYGAWSDVPSTDLTNNWWNAITGPRTTPTGSGDRVSANINYTPFLADPPAYAHFQPGNQITVGLGQIVTLDLFVNAGTHPAMGQQSYLTFPPARLQNVNPITSAPSNTVTHDLTTFPTELQNQVNNGTGEIAYASGSNLGPPPAPGATGDFRVAQVTFMANALGDATVHWQFYPPDPANRNSKITDATNVVSDRTLYQDYVIHVVTPQFTGHVIWQGRPLPQPNALQVLPLNLTLTTTGTDYHFDNLTTDANGNFTVNLPTMPNGTYTWRVKGPTYLSTSGSFVYSHAPGTTVEMGLQLAGDANNDNLVDISDFGILYASFGHAYPDPLFDARADWTGDHVVDISDFGLLSGNFGQIGNRPVQAAKAPQTGGHAVLELRPQGKAPANGGTVHVGDRFVLELWVNAQPGTTVGGQQSYLTFPAAALQLGNPSPGSDNPARVTADGQVLNLTLQNAICNSPASCTFNGLKMPAGSLAFASGTFAPTGGSGSFRIGQVTVQATAPGTAQLHWQMGTSAPNNRTSKLLTTPAMADSQDVRFADYVLNVLPAGK